MKLPLSHEHKASPHPTEGRSPVMEDALALWHAYIQSDCWDAFEALGRAMWQYGLIGADKVFPTRKREAPCAAPQGQRPPRQANGASRAEKPILATNLGLTGAGSDAPNG